MTHFTQPIAFVAIWWYMLCSCYTYHDNPFLVSANDQDSNFDTYIICSYNVNFYQDKLQHFLANDYFVPFLKNCGIRRSPKQTRSSWYFAYCVCFKWYYAVISLCSMSPMPYHKPGISCATMTEQRKRAVFCLQWVGFQLRSLIDIELFQCKTFVQIIQFPKASYTQLPRHLPWDHPFSKNTDT